MNDNGIKFGEAGKDLIDILKVIFGMLVGLLIGATIGILITLFF